MTTDNIAGILDEPAGADPERAALITDDGTIWSYGALRRESERWAATIVASGVEPGDRIALVDWGGVRSTAVTLAAAHVGAAAAQMNPLLTTRELVQLVEVSACSRLGVSGHDGRPALAAALGDAGTVLATAGRDAPVPERAPGGPDDALILFTSGTTGVPKPVAVSHQAIAERLGAYRAPFDASRAPNVTIMCVPSFHVGGMLGLLLTLYAGDTTVIQPRFDPGRWLASVSRHRVTSAFLVPTMLARILDHPDLASTDLSSLRSIAYGAAAAPRALIERAMAQWPAVAFANVFGQTETLGAYAALSPDDHRNPERIGSVGRPLPGVEVRVVAPDTTAPVAPGAVGELWVRASQTVGGGWLETGDLARQDGDGYLYPCGRRSDTINRGGEKFAPAEVDEALRSHPSVADLVVVGVPDSEMGERVGVAIVTPPGADPLLLDEVRRWCRGRIAPFKLPEVLVIVDALPYNELGKLPRRAAVDLITAGVERGAS